MPKTDNTNSNQPGRSCPVHYRYRPEDIASVDAPETSVLYLVGGLYGNTEALATVMAIVNKETAPVTVCINGDFNWFNVDPENFNWINQTVLQFDLIRGNVETEISDLSIAGDCGCAYPDWVDEDVVSRSNLIIQRLKKTASGFPAIISKLNKLPMYRRYRVGEMSVAVVHGDLESLSGWGLSQETIDHPVQQALVSQWSIRSKCQMIASTHTCLPFLYQSDEVVVINNGAAGMPNFNETCFGCVSRIAATPRPTEIESLYGIKTGAVYVDSIPVQYDQKKWMDTFNQQWAPGSSAYESYIHRLNGDAKYTLEQALRGKALQV